MILLKDIYNQDFLDELASEIAIYDKEFRKKEFVNSLIKNCWNQKELKERMRAITIALDKYLTPPDLERKIEILKKTAQSIKKGKNSGLSLIIFPDYIEVFCQEKDYRIAISALKFFTSRDCPESNLNKALQLLNISTCLRQQ